MRRKALRKARDAGRRALGGEWGRRTRSNKSRGGTPYIVALLVQLTSSLKGAARDDHRQNLIFSLFTNRSENPTSKTINLATDYDYDYDRD